VGGYDLKTIAARWGPNALGLTKGVNAGHVEQRGTRGGASGGERVPPTERSRDGRPDMTLGRWEKEMVAAPLALGGLAGRQKAGRHSGTRPRSPYQAVRPRPHVAEAGIGGAGSSEHAS